MTYLEITRGPVPSSLIHGFKLYQSSSQLMSHAEDFLFQKRRKYFLDINVLIHNFKPVSDFAYKNYLNIYHRQENVFTAQPSSTRTDSGQSCVFSRFLCINCANCQLLGQHNKPIHLRCSLNIRKNYGRLIRF